MVNDSFDELVDKVARTIFEKPVSIDFLSFREPKCVFRGFSYTQLEEKILSAIQGQNRGARREFGDSEEAKPNFLSLVVSF
jgi:hypothetical protein